MERDERGNRQRILDAVVRLLDEGHPAPVTVAEIAEEAHIAPATLYYHFSDRSQLVAEAQAVRLMRLFDRIDPPTEETLVEISEEDRDGYEGAVARSRASYWDPANRELLWGYLEVLIEIRKEPEVLALVADPLRERLAMRVRAVEELQRLGWVTDEVDAGEWVLFYFGAVFGQVIWDLLPEVDGRSGESSAVAWVHARIAEGAAQDGQPPA